MERQRESHHDYAKHVRCPFHNSIAEGFRVKWFSNPTNILNRPLGEGHVGTPFQFLAFRQLLARSSDAPRGTGLRNGNILLPHLCSDKCRSRIGHRGPDVRWNIRTNASFKRRRRTYLAEFGCTPCKGGCSRMPCDRVREYDCRLVKGNGIENARIGVLLFPQTTFMATALHPSRRLARG